MKSRPEISLIVPHLNQPEHLRRCLGALTKQSLGREEFEIIVVDNGSREAPAWVSEWDALLVAESTPGPGPARNRGVAVARGEVLAFIDADCIADRNWLAEMRNALSAGGPRCIVGGDVRVGCADPARMTMIEAYETVFAYRQREYIEKKGFSGAGNLMVRRADFDRIGPFAGITVSEDRDWGRRATALGYRIVYAPRAIVYHPARASLDEILTKWRRHTDHDFAEWMRADRGVATWLLRAVALAVSPAFDIARIIGSRRLSGMRNRLLAFSALIQIRLWRAGRMVRLATQPQASLGAQSWNR